MVGGADMVAAMADTADMAAGMGMADRSPWAGTATVPPFPTMRPPTTTTPLTRFGITRERAIMIGIIARGIIAGTGDPDRGC
jgi:hypothetical protein